MPPVVQVDCTPVQAWYNGSIVVHAEQYKSDGTWLRIQILQILGPGMPSHVSVRSFHGNLACMLQNQHPPSAQICSIMILVKHPQSTPMFIYPGVLLVHRKGWRSFRPEGWGGSTVEALDKHVGRLLGDCGRTGCTVGLLDSS